MTKFLFGSALAALALAIPAAGAAQRLGPAVVAVVDTDRISRECTACRAAATQLQNQGNTLRTRAQTLQQQLQTQGTPIQQAVAALNGRQPDAALQTRITAYQTQQNNAQQELARGEQNLRSIQAHVQQQIGTRLQPIISTVMNSRGANIAVDRGATLAAAPALDITNEVLAQLNQQLPSVSVTPLPQQPQQQRNQGR
ncbi:MAG TPA: OmpH family outer membrane protein [Allosphingosinicella sp.]|jgi:Skp family chaperone for outer membrane proteins|uniref:OmpH family outer membrane protein n=1 Tax=Allosphingosinicella sp. TaxID=2823234 RepID=UPI002F279D84